MLTKGARLDRGLLSLPLGYLSGTVVLTTYLK